MDKQDKKYYFVTLSSGVKNIVEDGFSDEKNGFVESLNVYAEETNGELIEIISGVKILDIKDNENPNVFDVKTFIEGGYGLFGISKSQKETGEIRHHLEFMTRQDTTKFYNEIIDLIRLTRKEAKKQYELLKDAERSFKEEINKGRK